MSYLNFTLELQTNRWHHWYCKQRNDRNRACLMMIVSHIVTPMHFFSVIISVPRSHPWNFITVIASIMMYLSESWLVKIFSASINRLDTDPWAIVLFFVERFSIFLYGSFPFLYCFAHFSVLSSLTMLTSKAKLSSAYITFGDKLDKNADPPPSTWIHSLYMG